MLQIFPTQNNIRQCIFVFLCLPPLQNRKSLWNENATHRVAPQLVILLNRLKMKKSLAHEKWNKLYEKFCIKFSLGTHMLCNAMETASPNPKIKRKAERLNESFRKFRFYKVNNQDRDSAKMRNRQPMQFVIQMQFEKNVIGE